VLHDWCLAGYGIAWRSTWEVEAEIAAGQLVAVLEELCRAAQRHLRRLSPAQAPATARAPVDRLHQGALQRAGVLEQGLRAPWFATELKELLAHIRRAPVARTEPKAGLPRVEPASSWARRADYWALPSLPKGSVKRDRPSVSLSISGDLGALHAVELVAVGREKRGGRWPSSSPSSSAAAAARWCLAAAWKWCAAMRW